MASFNTLYSVCPSGLCSSCRLTYCSNKTAPFEELTTPNTNVNTRAYVDPTYISDFPESVRCGRDNMAHAAATEILTVRPGDTIEAAHVRSGPEYKSWRDVMWDDCPEGRGSCIPPEIYPSVGFEPLNNPSDREMGFARCALLKLS